MLSRGMPCISHSELEFSLNTTHSPKAIQTLLKARVYTEKPGAHNPERATSILAAYVTAFLRTSLFLDTFQGSFFPRKQNLHHVYESIRRIRYLKGKLNVIKRLKISFLGLQVLLTGMWNLKDIQNSLQNSSKNKLVLENAVTRAHRSWSLLAVWAAGETDQVTREIFHGISFQTSEKFLSLFSLRAFQIFQ